MLRFGLTVLAILLTITSAQAKQPANEVRVYVFGNSLVHHLTKTDETTIPHWLQLLSNAGGKSFAPDGQWGFLRNFANQLPPDPNWSFKQVRQAWNSSGFAKSGYNKIIITPANFIQYQPADRRYDGENPTRQSPLSATVKLIDWIESKGKDQTYYIFEGWTDMATFSENFPPNPRAYKKFLNHNIGPVRVWFVTYTEMIKAKRQDIDVKLLPVGSTLSKMLQQPSLSKLKPQVMFSDNAPHGTANTYFLAALVTYAAIYGEPAPSNFTPPGSLSREIVENYKNLAGLACKEVARLNSCTMPSN